MGQDQHHRCWVLWCSRRSRSSHSASARISASSCSAGAQSGAGSRQLHARACSRPQQPRRPFPPAQQDLTPRVMAPTRTAAAVAAAAAALCLLLAAAPAAAFTKPDQLELITAFRDAMLARPGQVNWTKALASWTCPTPADNSVGGTCDPCGQQVGCKLKLWQRACAITVAACSALAAVGSARCMHARLAWRQPGTTAFHRPLPCCLHFNNSQVWGNWEHLACRGERIAEDKYRVSGMRWVLGAGCRPCCWAAARRCRGAGREAALGAAAAVPTRLQPLGVPPALSPARPYCDASSVYLGTLCRCLVTASSPTSTSLVGVGRLVARPALPG